MTLFCSICAKQKWFHNLQTLHEKNDISDNVEVGDKINDYYFSNHGESFSASHQTKMRQKVNRALQITSRD